MGCAGERQQRAAAHQDQEGPELYNMARSHEHDHQGENYLADYKVEDASGHRGGPFAALGQACPASGENSAGAAQNPEQNGTHPAQRTSET